MGTPLRSSALFKIDLASVLRGPQPGGFLEQMSAPQEAVKSVKKMGKIEQSKLILHSKCVATYAAPVFLPEPEKGLSQKKKKRKKQKSEAEAAVAKIRVEAARTLRKQKAQAARKQQEAEAVRRQEKAEAARKQQDALAARRKAKAGLSVCSTSCEASKVDVKSIQEVVVYVDGSRRGSLAGVGVAFVDVRLRHLNKSLRLAGKHTSGTAEVAAAEQVVTIVGGNWKHFEGKTRSIVIRSDHSSLVKAMQSKNYTWKMGNLYQNLANKIAQLKPLKVSFQHVLKATRVKEHVEAHNFAGKATNPKPVCVSPPSIGKTKKKQQNTVPSKEKENKKKKEEKQKSSPSVTVTKKQKSQMVIPPVTVSKKQNVACVTVSKKQKTQSVIPPVTVSKKQKKQVIVVEEKAIEQEQIKLPEPEVLIQPCSLSSPTMQGGRILCEYRTAIISTLLVSLLIASWLLL